MPGPSSKKVASAAGCENRRLATDGDPKVTSAAPPPAGHPGVIWAPPVVRDELRACRCTPDPASAAP